MASILNSRGSLAKAIKEIKGMQNLTQKKISGNSPKLG